MTTKGRCFPEAFICFQKKPEHLPGAHLNHICSSFLHQNLTVNAKENAPRVTWHNSRLHTAFHWHIYNPFIYEYRIRCLSRLVQIASYVWWSNELINTFIITGSLKILKCQNIWLPKHAEEKWCYYLVKNARIKREGNQYPSLSNFMVKQI